MFSLIINNAFGAQAAFGAMLGLAVEWGVKRGIYSNEAGQGTGPHSAAAAEVSHPAKQGYVQAFSIYVDTLLVCSATAFMILSTGKYNVTNPAGAMIVKNLPGMETGPGYTQAAVESVFPGFGASFVALAIMFFAFTTIVAYYYMAETNIQYINRKLHRPWTLMVLKVVMMLSVGFGAVRSAGSCVGPRRHGRRPHGVAQYHRDPDPAAAGAPRAQGLRAAKEGRRETGVRPGGARDP